MGAFEYPINFWLLRCERGHFRNVLQMEILKKRLDVAAQASRDHPIKTAAALRQQKWEYKIFKYGMNFNKNRSVKIFFKSTNSFCMITTKEYWTLILYRLCFQST